MWLFASECVTCRAPANGLCQACADALVAPEVPPLLAVDDATVLCSYEGVGQRLVHALKFENRRHALGAIADALAPSLRGDHDAIVAVPADPIRRRERGYDLPALLARKLARRLDVEVVEPLERVGSDRQTGRSRSDRRGVEYRTMSRVPERVLLVDDVVTTGATAVACAVALGLAGARRIDFVALAATPRQVDAPVIPLTSSLR